MSHFCRVSAGLYKDCWSISCFHGPYHELALGAKLLQYVFLSFLSFLHFFASELLARQPIPPWWSAGIWLLLHPPWQPPKSTCFECGRALQSAKLAHTSKCMQIQANALFHSEEWSGSSPFSCLVQSCTEIWGLSYVICIIVMLMSMQWARWHVLRRFNYASVIFVHWTSHCSHLFTTTPWPKTCVVNRDDTKGDSDSHCSPPRGTGMSR